MSEATSDASRRVRPTIATSEIPNSAPSYKTVVEHLISAEELITTRPDVGLSPELRNELAQLWEQTMAPARTWQRESGLQSSIPFEDASEFLEPLNTFMERLKTIHDQGHGSKTTRVGARILERVQHMWDATRSFDVELSEDLIRVMSSMKSDFAIRHIAHERRSYGAALAVGLLGSIAATLTSQYFTEPLSYCPPCQAIATVTEYVRVPDMAAVFFNVHQMKAAEPEQTATTHTINVPGETANPRGAIE